jgi:cell wall assembly regulator SMI1
MMTPAGYLAGLRRAYEQAGRPIELAAGATSAALSALEHVTGQPLDACLRELWTWHDGGAANQPAFARPGLGTGYDFLPVAQALREYEALARRAPRYRDYPEPVPRDRRIRPGWFHPGWLPFAGSGEGARLLMVDASPSASGTVGQVIAFTHDPDTVDYVDASLADFLTVSLAAIIANPAGVLAH